MKKSIYPGRELEIFKENWRITYDEKTKHCN
jgi:hypothetical protein